MTLEIRTYPSKLIEEATFYKIWSFPPYMNIYNKEFDAQRCARESTQ